MCLDRPQRAEQLAEQLQDDVDHMVELLESLVDFARVRPPQVESVELEDLCYEVLSGLSFSPAIEVRIEAQAFAPPARVDRHQIRSVLSNLVRNGIEAMPGGGTLTVEIAPHGDQGVRVTVRDQGVGMATEIQERLFEPLFTTKSRGTGLGMGIVQNFV